MLLPEEMLIAVAHHVLTMMADLNVECHLIELPLVLSSFACALKDLGLLESEMVSVVTVELVLQAEKVAEGAHSIQVVVLNKNLIVISRIRWQYLIFAIGIFITDLNYLEDQLLPLDQI